MKKLQGKITISRYTVGPNRSGITIRLEDETSGVECVEIELTVDALGLAITGASCQPCEFELRPAFVGKIREYKTEVIPFDLKNYNKQKAEAKAALKPYEIDGWTGNSNDLLNHHRRIGADSFRVAFHRYVDAPEIAREQKGEG